MTYQHRDEWGRWTGLTVQLCPVCYQRVNPTWLHRNIEAHTDTLGLERCPGSGEPYRITVSAPSGTERRLVGAA